jgi:hypothetical protein
VRSRSSEDGGVGMLSSTSVKRLRFRSSDGAARFGNGISCFAARTAGRTGFAAGFEAAGFVRGWIFLDFAGTFLAFLAAAFFGERAEREVVVLRDRAGFRTVRFFAAVADRRAALRAALPAPGRVRPLTFAFFLAIGV